MPCQPARARKLLRQGKAAVLRHQPFTIILKHRESGDTQPTEIKVDPGSKTTGIAVVVHGLRGSRCVYGINIVHRGDRIRDTLASRSLIRRGRRQRKTRYRPARFKNRTKLQGWMPPSVHHRLLTTNTWIDRLTRWCSVTLSSTEIVKFDAQKLRNPDIAGKAYQQGPLFGTEMREYLLTVYQHTCQYCKGVSGDKILNWEHKVPRSRGGSNALSNATLACRRCNELKDNLTPTEWLAKVQHLKGKYHEALCNYIPKVIKSQKPTLRDAAVMNAVRYKIDDYLTELGLNPEQSPGWVTKRHRLDQHYRKDHWIDAACVGTSGKVVYITPAHKCLTVKCMGHGSRQMCQMNKYGNPRSAPKTTSTINGFKTGDLVRAVVPGGVHRGIHVGRVVVKKSSWFKMGKATIHVKNITLLQKDDGFRYSYGTNSLITVTKTKEMSAQLSSLIPPNSNYVVQKKITQGDKITYLINVNI